jgi:small subunit ribosomal protein S1
LTTDPEAQPAGGERPAADMATLLEESEDYRSPHRGEIVEGVVMGWDRDGALVDIGAKSEGIILRHEMQSLAGDAESKLKSGDKVMVFVIQPDSADGQITLSLDRARGEQGWLTLQQLHDSAETFEAQVTGYNKGGLLVNVEGVNAFVPLSQVTCVRPDRSREDGVSASLAEAVGMNVRLKVIEINRRRNRVILSERAAQQEWRSQQKERLIQELREGEIRKGIVSSVRSFGVFVDLGGADGLAHLSELSWDRDKSPMDLFKVGDEVDAYITKIDEDNKKIALSLRRAQPEQWDAVVDKYQEGRVVTGLVTKLVTFGAFARIEGPVEGLIHVSELVDRRIGHPKEVVREGDLLPLKIVRIERDRHRLGLSLRRARDEGTEMGFVFSEGGEVLSVPEDIRSEFEAREGPITIPTQADEGEASEEAPASETAEAVVDQPSEDAAPEAPEVTSVESEEAANVQPDIEAIVEPGAPVEQAATDVAPPIEPEASATGMPAVGPPELAGTEQEPGAPQPAMDDTRPSSPEPEPAAVAANNEGHYTNAASVEGDQGSNLGSTPMEAPALVGEEDDKPATS